MAEMSPEARAQLEEQKKNCVFCKIMKGEVQSSKVYEDGFMTGILDINPCAKGHLLLMPKEHYPVMPLIPAETFIHMFSRIPTLVGAVKKAMVCTGANVLIANGAAAGQQAPHFLLHIFAREKGDSMDKYQFSSRGMFDSQKNEQATALLANNYPMMLARHFSQNPARWHTGDIRTASFLSEVARDGKKIYEDEKLLCMIPTAQACMGHMVLYSNEEEHNLEKLSSESAVHLFHAASLAATAAFEGLGAHGTNIIVKSGLSTDNGQSRLCVHILPRYQGDGIDVSPTPMKQKPNLQDVASKIKDETFVLQHQGKEEKKKPEVIDLDNRNDIMVIGGKRKVVSDARREQPQKPIDEEEEIARAIRRIRDID